MPTKEMNPGEVKAGENTFLDFCTQHSKKFVIAAVILAGAALAALGGIWSVYRNYDPNLLATVGGEKIMKSDLNQALYRRTLIGTPSNPGEVPKEQKDQALQELIEAKMIAQTAKQAGITATPDEILADVKSKDIGYDEMSEKFKQMAREEAEKRVLKEKIRNQLFTWKEGNYLIFHYDKYNEVYKDHGIAGSGDQTLLNKQKTYAENLAKSVQTKLNNKQLTFDQARELLYGDKEIGQAAYGVLKPNMDGSLDKEAYVDALNYYNTNAYQGFREIANQSSLNNVGAPQVLKNASGLEVGYVLFQVTKENNGTINQDYSSWLQSEYINKTVASSLNTKSLGLLTPSNAYAGPTGTTFNCYVGTSDNSSFLSYFLWQDGMGNQHGIDNMHMRAVNDRGRIETFYAACGSAGFKTTTLWNNEVTNSSGQWWLHQGHYTGTSSTPSYSDYAYQLDCTTTSVIAVEYDYANFSPAKFGYPASITGDVYYDSLSGASHVHATNVSAGQALPVDTNGGTWKRLNLEYYYNGAYGNGEVPTVKVVWKGNKNVMTAAVSPAGKGKVTAPKGLGDAVQDGIECDSATLTTNCAEKYFNGEPATRFTANPYTGYEFDYWDVYYSGAHHSYAGTDSGSSNYLDVAHNTAATITAYFKVIPPAGTPTLSCDVASPLSGEAPLAVRIQFTSLDANKNLVAATVGTGESTDGGAIAAANALIDPKEITIPGRTSPFVYTYGGAGTYTPGVSRADVAGDDGVLGHWKRCTNSQVTVTDPSNPDGGEQPPTN